MSAKAVSRRAGNPVRVAANDTIGAPRVANGRTGERRAGGALPTMRASARRNAARVEGREPARRKAKRGRRAPSLGGRMAAAIRAARLRACRAAEEFGLRR
ncbi:hypothetical protein [Frateuria sp. STR12]|uniref:hypothetical protein n=1 Tax=Frateuria hangzhouensis TaxID=2995589 RepID=UPI002260F61E|nr:hypothetical protein [Frateuria sp. STR12]MCX7512298.1 hypothetical protein [Frateuria sp. STR12]